MENWREIVADWQGDTTFIGENTAGGKVQIGNLEAQPGLSPMELLLASLAGCTGSDVVSMLIKQRQPLKAFKVRVRGKRRQEQPRIYTEIEVEYLLWGIGLEPKRVERAVTLSREKYCSVSAMLEPSASIRFIYKIIEE